MLNIIISMISVRFIGQNFTLLLIWWLILLFLQHSICLLHKCNMISATFIAHTNVCFFHKRKAHPHWRPAFPIEGCVGIPRYQKKEEAPSSLSTKNVKGGETLYILFKENIIYIEPNNTPHIYCYISIIIGYIIHNYILDQPIWNIACYETVECM